jgi:hypothetical protein
LLAAGSLPAVFTLGSNVVIARDIVRSSLETEITQAVSDPERSVNSLPETIAIMTRLLSAAVSPTKSLMDSQSAALSSVKAEARSGSSPPMQVARFRSDRDQGRIVERTAELEALAYSAPASATPELDAGKAELERRHAR